VELENIEKVIRWLVNDVLPKLKEISKLKKELDALLNTRISLDIPAIDVYVDVNLENNLEKFRLMRYLSTNDELMCKEGMQFYDTIRINVHGVTIEVKLMNSADTTRSNIDITVERLVDLLALACILDDELMERITRAIEEKEVRIKETIEKIKQVIVMLKMLGMEIIS
jgi:hypothetical protein